MRAAVRFISPLLLAFSLTAFGGVSEPSHEDSADDGSDDDGVASVFELTGGHRHRGCPASMARVGDYCIDRYEAPNARGAKPLVMQSASDADEWCSRRHKRLCTEDEWIGACEGSDKRAYPYGDTHEDGRCNDDKPWRSVDEAVLAKWPDDEAKEHTRSLYQATPSGTKRGCVTDEGIFDLTGNVEEWVTRTRSHATNYDHILIGCYWSGCYGGGKPTCHSTNAAHGPDFRFYETGIRCCKDVPKPQEEMPER